jgi:N-acetyl-alpha-D-muramate 1-phosphate uridylyltransferase
MYPVAILAGGIATRMRPHTDSLPKALLPVAGEPFIAHQLAQLRDQQITNVVLCVGHLGEQIRQFVGDGGPWRLHVSYSFDGPTLLGTGGALRRALPLLGDAFFVLYGDSYLRCDFASVARTFEESRRPGLMTVYRNDNALEPSNVRFERGAVVEYDKRARSPLMRHIDYGLSVLSAAVVASYPEGERFDLSLIHQDLIAARQLAGFEVSERFFEIGSPEGLRDTELLLTRSKASR